jgi:hypothetical protein
VPGGPPVDGFCLRRAATCHTLLRPAACHRSDDLSPFVVPRAARSPDGLKKAYVRLTTDYDALDVANKIGII